jgi:hypothetical protein
VQNKEDPHTIPAVNGNPEPEKRRILKTVFDTDGPDVIRTHDLPVISRAHHRAMLRAQKFA